MSNEFYLKTKYTKHYLSWKVPWSKQAGRRRKFTYKELEIMSDELMAIIDIVEIDEKYEAKMDKKEREWYAAEEQRPKEDQLGLFEEYSEIDDKQLDEALMHLEGSSE